MKYTFFTSSKDIINSKTKILNTIDKLDIYNKNKIDTEFFCYITYKDLLISNIDNIIDKAKNKIIILEGNKYLMTAFYEIEKKEKLIKLNERIKLITNKIDKWIVLNHYTTEQIRKSDYVIVSGLKYIKQDKKDYNIEAIEYLTDTKSFIYIYERQTEIIIPDNKFFLLKKVKKGEYKFNIYKRKDINNFYTVEQITKILKDEKITKLILKDIYNLINPFFKILKQKVKYNIPTEAYQNIFISNFFNEEIDICIKTNIDYIYEYLKYVKENKHLTYFKQKFNLIPQDYLQDIEEKFTYIFNFLNLNLDYYLEIKNIANKCLKMANELLEN